MKANWDKFLEVTIAHHRWELLLMRVIFSGLLWRLLPQDLPYLHQPMPNGFAVFLDLTFLANGDLYVVLRIVFTVALVLFTLGLIPVISLGYVTLLLTMVGALENAQGAIGHHLQLACMVAGAQWLVYCAGLKEGSRAMLIPSVERHQQATQWAKIMIVASYVTSACVKLIASGGLWIVQLPNISLQLVKTHANVYYDTLWPQTGWMANQLPYYIAAYPNLTRMFFTPGLLLELFAFLALTGRRAAVFFGASLLTMHLLVRWVMNLSFSSHEWLLVIYLINLPYLVWLIYVRLAKNPSNLAK